MKNGGVLVGSLEHNKRYATNKKTHPRGGHGKVVLGPLVTRYTNSSKVCLTHHSL